MARMDMDLRANTRLSDGQREAVMELRRQRLRLAAKRARTAAALGTTDDELARNRDDEQRVLNAVVWPLPQQPPIVAGVLEHAAPPS